MNEPLCEPFFSSNETFPPGQSFNSLVTWTLDTIARMTIPNAVFCATAGVYRVARDDLAFRDLLFEFVSPPPTIAATASSRSHLLGGASTSSSSAAAADLMQMGFPALLTTTYPGVCACHGKLKTSGYGCPRCKARLCDVPTECRVCGLTVVNAPQLARSYRHLFPVRGVVAVFSLSLCFPLLASGCGLFV